MLIYRAIFSNKKSYIGKTTNTLEKRKREHKNKSAKGYNFLFYRAIRKYGFKNIKWKILENNIIDQKILNKKEKYYIKKYKTFGKNGYNLTAGGEGISGWKHSKETRKKISKHHHNVGGKNNPMYGKHHSKEMKKKLRKIRLGTKHSEKSKRRLSKINKGIKNPMYGIHRYGKDAPHFGCKHTKKTKKIIGDSKLGKKHSEKTKKLLSKLNKGEKNHNFQWIYYFENIKTKKKLNTEGTSLAEFCNKNKNLNFRYEFIRRKSRDNNNNIKNYQGWKIKRLKYGKL